MKTRLLGKTGEQVSELGLGTCFMAGQGQEGVNRCVTRAVELGVNYFDTAADYGKGNDERMLGIALQPFRHNVFLATKVGCVTETNGHRRVDSLMRQFDGGLKNLQTDHVDLIQLHEADQRKWWSDDSVTEHEAVDHCGELIRDEEEYDFAGSPCMEFLRQAKASGKARFIGITGKDARRLARIVEALELDSMMMAHQFNPILHNAGKYLLPVTAAKNVGVVNGAAFMKGWLAVPQTEWRTSPPPWMDEEFRRAYFAYLDIHASSGLPLAELTLRWQLAEPRQHSVVVGFSRIEDIEQNVAAVSRGKLPAELQQAIDAVGIVHPLIYQMRKTL